MPVLGGVASAPYSLGPLWISCLILRTPTLDFVRTSYMTVESVSFGASPLDAELKCALPCSWACRAAGRAAPCVAAAHTPTRLTSTRPCDTLYPQCVSRDAVVPCSSTLL